MLVKTGTDSLRVQNRALVLATLRELGPSAHTKISEWSGLSSATVSAITSALENEGAIERTDVRRQPQAGSSRGRPRQLFTQSPDCAYVAAVRISFDQIEYSLVNYRGTLTDRFNEKRPENALDVEAFARVFKAGLERLVSRSNLSPKKLKLVSISTKGIVSATRPLLLWSPVLDGARIDFEHLLPEYQGRISLTNEAHFAAQAAALHTERLKPEYPARRSATLSLDNSIGLGLATDRGIGKVSALAPGFGHMTHAADGPKCRCGANGCIEAYTGFYGILRTAFEVPPQTIPAKFIPVSEMDKIAENARRGDRASQYAFRLAGEVLGLGISRLISLHGLMPLQVTGPGMRYFDLLREGFEANVNNTLEVRLGNAPSITLIEDEANLIFEGNIQNALAHLDANVLAEGRWE